VGEGDRPSIKRELTELILDVADVEEFDWDGELTVIDSAESIDDLWQMEGAADALIRAATSVRNQIRELMRQDVAEFGPIKLGDTLYRSKRDSKRQIIDGMGDKLLEWLGDDLRFAVNPNTVRITSVRAIAEERGIDAEVIEDSFYVDRDDPDAPLVLEKLGSRSPKICAAAAFAAGELEVKPALPRLLELLEDSDYDVRSKAIWALSLIGGDTAKERLEALYEETADLEEQDLIEDALDNLEFLLGQTDKSVR